MALVWSRQHKVYKTKQSHSCQPTWLPVSHDTLVQEGNHLSHTRHSAKCLEGKHTQDICTQTVYREGTPTGTALVARVLSHGISQLNHVPRIWVPYFTMYNAHFFAQIFQGKIRMHITHGQYLTCLSLFILVFCNLFHKISCTIICSKLNDKMPL